VFNTEDSTLLGTPLLRGVAAPRWLFKGLDEQAGCVCFGSKMLFLRKKVPGQDGTMNGQTQGLPLRELSHHFPDSSHVKITLLGKIFSLLQK
jgi:hypothetical protein